MDSKTRWQFNPFDKLQPLRKNENLPRSQSFNEIREQQRQPVRIMLCFLYHIEGFIFRIFCLIVFARMFRILSYINFVLMNYLIFNMEKMRISIF